jgi:L-iditol 2-dehydrogenase
MSKMTAAVFFAPHDLRLEEVDIPIAGPGEVVVRVRAAGICGTDVRIYNGAKKVKAPVIIGHEFAGEITQVGADENGFQVGDRVVVEPLIPCGRCPLCLLGRRNICIQRPTIGYEYDGAFAPYVRIPASGVASGNIIRISDRLSFEDAAIAEPVAACMNGIDRCNFDIGSTALILGGGPIGLIHLQLAKAAGALRVFLSEPDKERRQIALALGAEEVFDPTKDDVVNKIKSLTNGLGTDVSIVASGAPAAIETGMASLRKGGTLNLFAGSPPNSLVNFDPNKIHYGEITITGSSGHTAYQMQRAVRAIENSTVNAKMLITHKFLLSEISKALQAKQELTGLKHIIVME